MLIALTAIAMGTQNTSLRMAGILPIFTTHVTGALSRFGEQFVTWLLPRKGAPRSGDALAEAVLSAGLWLSFFVGALVASLLLNSWRPATVLIPPIAALVLVIAIDLLRPFAAPSR